jgi:hydroxysqualene dehydroxylase
MKNVAVVGGGLSGLAAAVALAGKGYRVTLLEQSTHLGGRAYSFRESITGSVLDNGQHLLLSCYSNTIEYLRRINSLHTVKTEKILKLTLAEPAHAPQIFSLRASDPSRFNYLRAILGFGMLSIRERMRLLNAGHMLFNRYEKVLRNASRLTVDEWLINMRQTVRARKVFWYPLAIAVMNELPTLAAAEPFVRAMYLAVFSGNGPAGIVTPLTGLSDVFVSPAVEYLNSNGATVRTQARVASLKKSGEEIGAVVLKSGEEIQTDAVILTGIPDHIEKLAGIAGFPDPALREYVPIITVNIWFTEKVSMPERVGMIGTAFHWVFRKDDTFSGRHGEEYISLVMSGAHEHVALPAEELLAFALSDVCSIFPYVKKYTVRHYKVIKEKRATVSLRPGNEPKRPGVHTPVKNLFLAGDWTDTKLPATIEGAVYSGFRAADAVMGVRMSEVGG